MVTDARSPESPAPPNIVLVLVDDLGWADLDCYGSSFYETPVLDRLATQGVRFTDAYAAAPVCSPTRASLLSGKYPARVGVTQYIGGHAVGKLQDVPYFACLPTSEYSLPRALRDGGYQTWNVGKWHLGSTPHTLPEAHGFDINIGGTGKGQPPQGYFSPYGLHTLPDGPDGEYLTDRLTDEAIGLIEGAGDRPYFLHLAHYAVHTPIQAPAELVAKYQAKAARLGLDRCETFADGEQHPAWHKQPERVRRRLLQSDPTYAAMVENLDTNIGRLLAAVEGTNTIVIFTSDNGGLATAEGSPTCNAPLAEGKGWTYDGGLRVPLLVHWPEVVTPGVTTEPTTTPDLYPTLLEAAGLPAHPEQHTDGVSILPLLRGEPFERGPIHWHYPHYANQGGTPSAAVREGPWKLVEFFEDDRVELYNLDSDISERHDLAHLPEHAALRDRLRTQVHHMREDMGALVPAPNPRARVDA
ncbi:sulfatase [Ruania alba]|uniref:Arylsulfatase A n=1 Tax=Ruania alba TaxID=648782 RepID=A0A1H5HLL0_9MICO|nr:sulfatase [Ruania alba]SEE28847.1 Arylsulfatase A [Ruania alba]